MAAAPPPPPYRWPASAVQLGQQVPGTGLASLSRGTGSQSVRGFRPAPVGLPAAAARGDLASAPYPLSGAAAAATVAATAPSSGPAAASSARLSPASAPWEGDPHYGSRLPGGAPAPRRAPYFLSAPSYFSAAPGGGGDALEAASGAEVQATGAEEDAEVHRPVEAWEGSSYRDARRTFLDQIAADEADCRAVQQQRTHAASVGLLATHADQVDARGSVVASAAGPASGAAGDTRRQPSAGHSASTRQPKNDPKAKAQTRGKDKKAAAKPKKKACC